MNEIQPGKEIKNEWVQLNSYSISGKMPQKNERKDRDGRTKTTQKINKDFISSKLGDCCMS